MKFNWHCDEQELLHANHYFLHSHINKNLTTGSPQTVDARSHIYTDKTKYNFLSSEETPFTTLHLMSELQTCSMLTHVSHSPFRYFINWFTAWNRYFYHSKCSRLDAAFKWPGCVTCSSMHYEVMRVLTTVKPTCNTVYNNIPTITINCHSTIKLDINFVSQSKKKIHLQLCMVPPLVVTIEIHYCASCEKKNTRPWRRQHPWQITRQAHSALLLWEGPFHLLKWRLCWLTQRGGMPFDLPRFHLTCGN